MNVATTTMKFNLKRSGVAISAAPLRRSVLAIIVFCILAFHSATGWGQAAADSDFVALKADAEQHFRDDVAPFIKTYCLDCHSSKRPTEAGLNFTPAIKTPGDPAFTRHWRKALVRVKAHDMPPDYARKQPPDEARQAFVDSLAKVKFLSRKDPGLFVIRRLTKTEYGNTLHDLLGVDPSIAIDLPDEVSGEGYLNSLSPLQLEQYLAIAEKSLNQVLAPPGAAPTETQQRLFGQPSADDAGARATPRDIARSLARKAYRRPPTEPELDVLLDVFQLGKHNKLNDQASLRLMLKAILISPQFLFITPAKETEPDAAIVPLDDYQLASRLSYFLWSTMPDDELMEVADSGRLRQTDILATQAKRMLNDPRSRALFDGFGAQWLGLDKLAGKTFDTELFPQMTSQLRSAMYDEARLLFESIVRENRPVVSFVDCDYTFLNEDLADIYGLERTIKGAELRKVRLSDENRGGILALPGILAANSFPNRTSAVKRGVWVLEQVLGEHVTSPPPDVPPLEKQEQATIANLTLRQRTELHRTNRVCANCHELLDPIGFGLENFDAIGRWRNQEENGQAIDASGELPGGKRFSGPKELKAIIAGRSDDFSRSLVERLLAYALCRRLEGYDEIVVDGLMHDIASDGHHMQTLVTAIVTSYPFTHRRIPEKVSEVSTAND